MVIFVISLYSSLDTTDLVTQLSGELFCVKWRGKVQGIKVATRKEVRKALLKVE